MKNSGKSTVYALCAVLLSGLIPTLARAQNQAVPVPRGGAKIDVSSNVPTLKLKNTTGETVFDVRFEILSGDSNEIKILAVDVVKAPGSVEDYDKVDDNDDGRIDTGPNTVENNQADASPGRTCRAIFGKTSEGKQTEVKNMEEIEVNLVLDLNPLPDSSQISVLFSTVGADPVNPGQTRHFDLCSVTPLGPAGSTFADQTPAGTHLANFLLTNTTADFIAVLLFQHPVPIERIALEPPYEASIAEPAGPGATMLFFNPPLTPFDYVDANVIYGVPFEPGMPPQVFVPLETFPYVCNLAMSNFIAGPCDAQGLFDLGFQLNYDPAGAENCQEFTFTNNTNQAMSDLHATFGGTGGALKTTIVQNAEGCPAPEIPSNDQAVSNMMELVWDSPCVQPGASVKVKVCSPHHPLAFYGGYWTLNGVNAGELTGGDVTEGPGGGPGDDQQNGGLDFYADGQYAGSYTPLGLGAEIVTLPGLPANGVTPDVFQVVWNNAFGCSAIALAPFTAPECAPSGSFAAAGTGALRCRILGNPAFDGAAPALEALLPEASEVVVTLYDSRGQRLRGLNSGVQPAGLQRLELPVEGLAPGVYWIDVQTANGRGGGKLVLLR